MIVPDDEMCIQQMLGIDVIPDDIQREYMIRARMLHRQLAGGAIGPIAIVDLLRALGYGPPPPSVSDDEGRIVWRRVEQGTPVNICVDGKWTDNPNVTYQGEVGGGTVAVQWPTGRIDEFNAYDVRLADLGLPSDVDAESFKGEADKPVGDARLELLDKKPEKKWVDPFTLPEFQYDPDAVFQADEDDEGAITDNVSVADAQNEVETPKLRGDIGDDDEIPPYIPDTKVNWGQVKKGTEVWLRVGEDMYEAEFLRCTGDGKASVLVEGEDEPLEVERSFLKIP